MNKIVNKLNFIKNYQDINYYKVVFTLLCIFLTYFLSRNFLEPFDLYREYFWLDIFMHILGGFLFSTLFFHISKKEYFNFKNIFYFIMFIGIIWEIYEIIFNVMIKNQESSGVLDTIKDLINDTIGAYIAFILNKKKTSI